MTTQTTLMPRQPSGKLCMVPCPPEVCDCGLWEQDLSALGGLDGPEIAVQLNKEAIAKVDADGDSDEN